MRVVYDFAQDGGAFADTYRLAEVKGKILVVQATVHVITAFTSGGSATVAVGAETADGDAFLAATAVGTLVDDYVVKTAAGQKLVIDGATATDYITVVLATADLTAGKLEVILEYVNID